jgi:hypothetical protein
VTDVVTQGDALLHMTVIARSKSRATLTRGRMTRALTAYMVKTVTMRHLE